jgi:hypothetical protein
MRPFDALPEARADSKLHGIVGFAQVEAWIERTQETGDAGLLLSWPSVSQSLCRERFLFVEDEAFVGEVGHELLRRAGYGCSKPCRLPPLEFASVRSDPILSQEGLGTRDSAMIEGLGFRKREPGRKPEPPQFSGGTCSVIHSPLCPRR